MNFIPAEDLLLVADSNIKGGLVPSLPVPVKKRSNEFHILFFRHETYPRKDRMGEGPPRELLHVDPCSGDVIEEKSVLPGELGFAWPGEWLPPGLVREDEQQIAAWGRSIQQSMSLANKLWPIFAQHPTPPNDAARQLAIDYVEAMLFGGGPWLRPYYEHLLKDVVQWSN